MSTPGIRLKEFRKRAGLTQGAFAEALGVSRVYVAMVETGKKLPSREFLMKLTAAYRVSADWVLTGEGSELVGTLDYPGASGRYVREFGLDRDEPEEDQNPPITLGSKLPHGSPGDVMLLSGQLPAGSPIVVEEHYREMLHLGSMFKGGVAIEVRGNSMLNAGISDGDVVIVRPQPEVRSGQIAALAVDEFATVKRLIDEGDYWRLQPENPEFEPERYRKSEGKVRVVGLVVGVIRKIFQ